MGTGRTHAAASKTKWENGRHAADFSTAVGRAPAATSSRWTGVQKRPEHSAKVQRGLDICAVTMEDSASELLDQAATVEGSPCFWPVTWENPLWPGQPPGSRAQASSLKMDKVQRPKGLVWSR